MTRIDDLEKRIIYLELNANKVTKEVTEIHDFIDNESDPTIEFKKDVEKLEKIKADITSYTLQLITIIVGIFALLVTVIFFILNKSLLNDLVWVIRLDIIFVLVLIAWFIIWFWKEDIFHCKRTNKAVRQISTILELERAEYKTRKYLLLSVLLGGLFGFIGSFVWGSYFWAKGNNNDEWMFWFGLIAYIVVGLFVMYMINLLDKKSKTK